MRSKPYLALAILAISLTPMARARQANTLSTPYMLALQLTEELRPSAALVRRTTQIFAAIRSQEPSARRWLNDLDWVSGEALIGLRAGTSLSGVLAPVADEVGGFEVAPMPERVFLLRFGGEISVPAVLARLEQQPGTEFAEPNYFHSIGSRESLRIQQSSYGYLVTYLRPVPPGAAAPDLDPASRRQEFRFDGCGRHIPDGGLTVPILIPYPGSQPDPTIGVKIPKLIPYGRNRCL